MLSEKKAEDMIKAFCKEEGIDEEDIADYDIGDSKVTIYQGQYTEHVVWENEEAAEEEAIDRVEQDLEYESGIFNQDWLRNAMAGVTCKDLEEHGSVYRAVAADAVAIDGAGHFLSSYDGGLYYLHGTDFVYARIN